MTVYVRMRRIDTGQGLKWNIFIGFMLEALKSLPKSAKDLLSVSLRTVNIKLNPLLEKAPLFQYHGNQYLDIR